jgi:hypothetical protein
MGMGIVVVYGLRLHVRASHAFTSARPSFMPHAALLWKYRRPTVFVAHDLLFVRTL